MEPSHAPPEEPEVSGAVNKFARSSPSLIKACTSGPYAGHRSHLPCGLLLDRRLKPWVRNLKPATTRFEEFPKIDSGICGSDVADDGKFRVSLLASLPHISFLRHSLVQPAEEFRELGRLGSIRRNICKSFRPATRELATALMRHTSRWLSAWNLFIMQRKISTPKRIFFRYARYRCRGVFCLCCNEK